MIKPRLFLCSGVEVSPDSPLREERVVIELDSFGSEPNVNIRIEDVAKALGTNISPRLTDLLEIASYVYTADAATRRGTEWTNDNTKESWERDFYFIIPVRDFAFWNQKKTKEKLVEILNFLSNDKYTFVFKRLKKERPAENYLEFGDEEEWPFYGVPRVLMFSGGLDSLAGAIETAKEGENILLVSHRSVSTLDSRQHKLFTGLKGHFSNQMFHVPVWINKEGNLGREHTQRTRSFLFSALGVVIAESIKAGGVRFFENGIVSLNLPVADEVQRARASRTTHPKSLALFTQFYTYLTGREFIVDNPFLFKTKADVVSLIAKAGAGDLIGRTCSCAHTGHYQSKAHWHCGTCSQCIDRRIAILAAGAEDYEEEDDYESNVFTGPRDDNYKHNIAVGYVRHTTELNRMSTMDIAAKFNKDITRAVRYFPRQRETAEQLIKLHKKHGRIVTQVIASQLSLNSENLLNNSLDKTSLLAMVAGQEHLASSWKRYAERIAALLKKGIPIICTPTARPDNEPRLQEICDGILQGHDEELTREFPFLRWSASATKPDWSKEGLGLWIELKYVRENKDRLKITNDIAVDITKYGDNGRRVLYLVYDPHHLITDEREFSAPIVQRDTMMVDFIR
jgi:hypothetical protein